MIYCDDLRQVLTLSKYLLLESGQMNIWTINFEILKLVFLKLLAREIAIFLKFWIFKIIILIMAKMVKVSQ
jgi:hypothetical protein